MAPKTSFTWTVVNRLARSAASNQTILSDEAMDSFVDIQPDPVQWVVQERDHRLVPDEVHVHDVTGRSRQQGWKQGPTVHIVAIRGLHGEQHTGGRCLEDGSHAGGGAGREEDLDVIAPQPAAEAIPHTQSDG